MADSFDQNRVREEHSAIISEVQRIRDGLTKDVIDYYYNAPISAEQDHEQRQGMGKYLRLAAERIDELLRGRLY